MVDLWAKENPGDAAIDLHDRIDDAMLRLTAVEGGWSRLAEAVACRASASLTALARRLGAQSAWRWECVVVEEVTQALRFTENKSKNHQPRLDAALIALLEAGMPVDGQADGQADAQEYSPPRGRLLGIALSLGMLDSARALARNGLTLTEKQVDSPALFAMRAALHPDAQLFQISMLAMETWPAERRQTSIDGALRYVTRGGIKSERASARLLVWGANAANWLSNDPEKEDEASREAPGAARTEQVAVAPGTDVAPMISPNMISPNMISLAKASCTAHGQLAAWRGARLWLDAHDEAEIGRPA
ncbi:MAG: hypothetical protein COY86_06190 [Rhodobacterales bacterium CG_4_10_14_0_8_um_filter_70_9]|nr:MAG: hypothetical protein COY86_06190 [Rhodobacterales bacterium CG_4_10_14_0_8_um_filter_70_9]